MSTEAGLFEPPPPVEFRRPALQPFIGTKLTVAELCAECGLVYADGRVHVPALPVERAKHEDSRIRRVV